MGKEIIRFLLCAFVIFALFYIVGTVYGKGTNNFIYRARIVNPNSFTTIEDFDELSKRVEQLELELQMLKKRRR